MLLVCYVTDPVTGCVAVCVASFFTSNCLSVRFSDNKELLGTVAELRHAHRKLNEQNSSLLRTVGQCEDYNLQLTLEITELRAKLARWTVNHVFFLK